MDILLPSQVQWLFSQFAKHDAELYLVGGSVRDAYLGRPIHDFDFATSATPQEMMTFLKDQPCKVIPTGLKHGTLTILYDHEAMEVTTYRLEGAYENHRRPKEVMFSRNLMDDLARRDFTMNAMAYHPDEGFIDPYGGCEDLQKGIINCVGDCEERFREDALRILRALRFSFQLQFSLTPACRLAIQSQAALLTHISKERIQEEFNKMLLADPDDLLTTLRECNVLSWIIPKITCIEDVSQESKWHQYDVFTHTDIALNHTKGMELCEKLAIVFHDFGKQQTKTIDESGHAHFYGHPIHSEAIARSALQTLCYPKKMIERIATLIAFHDTYLKPNRRILRRFLAKIDMDYDLAFAILRVQYADDCAKNMELAQDKLENINACNALLQQMREEEQSIKKADLAVNGHDLKSLGYEGKTIGIALHALYDAVIDDPTLNEQKQLLKLLEEMKIPH